MNKLVLIVQGENGTFKPMIEEGITWETERKNAPGKLSFKVLKDNIFDFQEGAKVIL